MEQGDRVRRKLGRGKYEYGTLLRTDRHRIEWLVLWDGERYAKLALGGDLEVVEEDAGR
jgi:hypothetical protein